MENDLVLQKKTNFNKIKDFAYANKESLRTAVAVLMLIMAIYNMRYVFGSLGSFFDWGFLYFIASIIGKISHALGVLGFGAAGIIILTKKKEELLHMTPYLIGASYLVYAVSDVLWIPFVGNFTLLVTAAIQIVMGILWIYVGVAMKEGKSAEEKEKELKIMIIAPVAAFIIRIILSAIGIAYGITFFNIVLSLIEAAILILFALTRVTSGKETYVNKEEKLLENNTINNVPNTNTVQTMPEGYSEVWKVIVFSIITLGIYFFIWIYRTVGLLNRKTLEDQSQGLQVVLCLFVPFYIIYWMYKESKRVEIYTTRVGNRNNDLSVISLILTVFGFSIIAAALMQDQINKNLLVEARISTDEYPYQDPAVKPSTEVAVQVATETKIEGTYEAKTVETSKQEPATNSINNNDIELLKKLKGLLDDGILTEEEFQAEKAKVLKK